MITFNDVEPPQTPNSVNENPMTVKTDTHAILGNVSRMQAPRKKRAVLNYIMATPETYQFFAALFDSATAIVYKNTESNESGGVLEFTGIIDFNEEDYVRGGSLMVPLTITMLEGEVND